MDLAGAQRLTCFLPTTSRLPSNTDDSRRNGRLSSFRMMDLLVWGTQTGWFVLDRLQVRRSGTLMQTFPAPA